MALLSLSAKKAGVFLRHFTRREKQSITPFAENSRAKGPWRERVPLCEAAWDTSTFLSSFSSRLNYL